MSETYKWIAISGIVVIIGISLYLYIEYLNPESAFLRSGGTPFWTVLEDDTREVIVQQGETKTIPVELHYWKGLRTGLGIKLEEPESENADLYNPPDGLRISFNLDDGYVQVDNGKITDIISHRNVTLKQPSEIQQRFEGGDMVVAEVDSIKISVSDDVPVGAYIFGIATTDARANSPNGDNIQLLAIRVVEGDASEATIVRLGSYPISIGNRTYDISFSFSSSEGTIKSVRISGSAAAIIVDVAAVGDTDLDIVLPRKFLEQLEKESGYHYCVGNEFAVFLNSIPADVFDFRDTDNGQILTIPLNMGSNTVEIIGTDLLESPPTCLHVGLEHYSFVKDLTGVEVDSWDEAVETARDYLDNLAQSNGEEKGANRGGPIGSVELVYLYDNGTAFVVNRYDGTLEDVYPYLNHTPMNSYFWIVTLNYEQQRETLEYIFTIDAQSGEVKELAAT